MRYLDKIVVSSEEDKKHTVTSVYLWHKANQLMFTFQLDTNESEMIPNAHTWCEGEWKSSVRKEHQNQNQNQKPKKKTNMFNQEFFFNCSFVLHPRWVRFKICSVHASACARLCNCMCQLPYSIDVDFMFNTFFFRF